MTPQDGRKICSLQEFAAYAGVPYMQMLRYLDEGFRKKKAYRVIPLPKGNGDVRQIEAPDPFLKKMQRIILEILNVLPISPEATAYVKGRSLTSAAAPHVGKPHMLKLDIEDFFGSIRFPKVFFLIDQALKMHPDFGPQATGEEIVPREETKLKEEAHLKEETVSKKKTNRREKEKGQYSSYNGSLSWALTALCTLEGRLPQGAPTSPALSNLAFFNLDREFQSYSCEHDLQYTRYSDDMFFSGESLARPKDVIAFVRGLLKRNGFFLNEEKTRILGPGTRHNVAGIVTNKRLQVSQDYRKKIRQDMYYIGKYGIEEHVRYINEKQKKTYGERYTEVKFLQHLLGQIAFVLQIDPVNKEFLIYKAECTDLLQNFSLLNIGSESQFTMVAYGRFDG